MRALIAIARREIVERRMAFVAAAVAALLPLAGRWAPLPIRSSRGLVTFILTATLAVSFTGALGIVLGASMIGRDLAERRMSFYLSRPLSARAIWFGKLIGNFLTAFLSALIVLTPAAVLVPDAWRGNWTLSAGETLACLGLGVLILLLVSHIAGTMVRSRSAWLLADLAAAVLVGACCGVVVRDAWRAGAVVTVTLEIAAIVAATLAVALAAGEIQLRRGRTDIRRNHRALSQALWGGMAIVAAMAIAWAIWIRNPPLRDLRVSQAIAPAKGPWIAIFGRGRLRLDYPVVRLLNTTSGAELRLSGDGPSWRSGFRFARDGRSVAWLDSADAARIGVADLATTARSRFLGVPDLTRLQDLAIAPDGSLVAALADGILAVFDVRSGRSIAAVHIEEELTNGRRTPQTPRPILSFPDDQHVVLYRAPGDRQPAGTSRLLTIDELDLEHHNLVRTGTFKASGSAIRVNPSADGRLQVTLFNDDVRGHETRYFILDGRSGAVLRQIEGNRVRLLVDGKVASLRQAGEKLSLVLENGAERVIDLGPAESGLLALPVAPGLITVVTRKRSGETEVRETLLVDEESGRVRARLADCWPVAWFSSGWADPPQPSPEAALFYQRGRLVRFDPARGRLVVLAGG